MIIAVDGPAASGKGTIARALAAHYRLSHLDTGLLYRAVGLGVLRRGGDAGDPDAALAATAFDDAMLADPEVRTEAASARAIVPLPLAAGPSTAMIIRCSPARLRPGF